MTQLNKPETNKEIANFCMDNIYWTDSASGDVQEGFMDCELEIEKALNQKDLQIAELEKKLALAVEALEKISLGTPNYFEQMRHLVELSKETLTKLKG